MVQSKVYLQYHKMTVYGSENLKVEDQSLEATNMAPELAVGKSLHSTPYTL